MNETKEHILKTSLLLFLQKSYRDVTMKEIVDKTGLSKGAFYHYFTSKEELFKEIALGFFSQGQINYSSFVQDTLFTFYNQYVEYVGFFFQQINELVGGPKAEKTSFNFFLILFEAVSRFPEFLLLELEQHKKDVEAWSNVILNARKNNEIRSTSSDEEIANLFLYCTDGSFIRFLNSEKTGSFKDTVKSAFDTVYNNIKT